MTFGFVTLQLGLLSLCFCNTVAFAYAPNNFYPGLRRGPSLSLQGGRSRSSVPNSFDVQPRTQTLLDREEEEDNEEEEEDEGAFPLIPLKDKRLVGIFRCYGWGPGCSDSSFISQKQTKTLSKSPVSRDGGSMHLKSSTLKNSGVVRPRQRTSSGGSVKYEPFFTLTSGKSWGPTGKKRNGNRRYSVSEKRLDFIKQILRDMLDDFDEGSSSVHGVQRPLSPKRPIKKYSIYKRQLPIDTSYLPPFNGFDLTRPTTPSDDDYYQSYFSLH